MRQKHIHILGICGTFMGGVAMIARQLGYKVTGSDTNVYPPMSTFLDKQGIEIIPNYDVSQLQPAPDMVVIGNAISRGIPCVEYVLEHQLHYTSGPQWLHDHLLKDRWVLAVAGTHGKTSTTGMLAWILDQNGIDTGFLIGGVAGNFGISARIGSTKFFVIEADEYDSAFFDKRSKFVHYSPRTLVINNLEFDHADIFADLAAIQRQFHNLVRTIPQSGCILSSITDQNTQAVLKMGNYSELQFSGQDQTWFAQPLVADCSAFEVHYQGNKAGQVQWNVIGAHNMHNALMAIAAAHHSGVSITGACQALASFVNVQRRLEVKGVVNNITVYDDFAHHPTAITATIDALRAKVGQQRILAVLEPRSNTMKMGVHKHELATSLQDADSVFIYQPPTIEWQVSEVLANLAQPAISADDVDELVMRIVQQAKPNDHILIMSNGAFGGIHQKLLTALANAFLMPS
ncbi:UDP-N-acetylmuramate:L-alanyl-gamma-D-glutamyl-meso-diaminopimelate ligase [[Haemophilus] ducreyi]|uniref:UDP-N-acetylmuramate--L-alanyl-gamma-D-glutamyl-meso-2,6-diaminoheptandioate ligase n=2 Tax=Haemophilus ducreyi TaxID=730 RepID=Q7VN73_HAEDU|nr:UDP-N-acetylmuramate:L-alanyl-gamma-D-glutamyl-meso-diaminopimelate ligase [[Haemophilus] ducreyi]AAP95619.1 UDP-N-acetylmuramate:L-alanyl-gamma-D-glutamayl-medo-diaminopimelate ligase [[Haemophilus] ducreyi 35000HP]AKO30691.1 UDP-N-acetylmuramate:L-alanyl-gamma-D-glutamyl-meso-diaminopimelate ligase [[Haemophilus] ducreyi]AKO32130.1 UDP-N-acetylmuramate:L-alanyl-gamma-D-glutamyl-meso-diaminopimelate ligase [[Haemophilus] ducreyi]AKO33585.1 UDP-N-acetylmuramate:L-alanyl-gamma-D-glutamyl-meso